MKLCKSCFKLFRIKYASNQIRMQTDPKLSVRNVLKWSEIFYNRYSKCCKIFKVCLTILGHKNQRVTLLWRRSLSFGNQSLDLKTKSVDWFLYEIRDLQTAVLNLFQANFPFLYLLKTPENYRFSDVFTS